MPLARYEEGIGNNRSLSHRQRSELYYSMRRSTAVINGKKEDARGVVIEERIGGGVILNEQGLILTSLALVHEVSSISVRLDGMSILYNAAKVFEDFRLDLALIQISGLNGDQRLMYAEISSQILVRGQEVTSIGGLPRSPPFLFAYSYTDELKEVGSVNALKQHIRWRGYEFPGMIPMVGSPVYDSSGNIVAMQLGSRPHYAGAVAGEKLLEFYLAYENRDVGVVGWYA